MAKEDAVCCSAERVSIPKAAEIIGITYQTAWIWTKKGLFKGVVREANGRYLIPASSVEAVRAERLARWNGRGARHDG